MKLFQLLTTVLFLLMTFPLISALSPPFQADIPLTGNPVRIDSDGKNIVAIAYSDRDVVGFYYVDSNAYLEIDLPSPVLKTVFFQNYAVALLRGGTSLVFIDLQSRKLVGVVQLESAASSITSGEKGVYVGYSRVGRIDRIDAQTMQAVESFTAKLSDGIEQLTAGGRILYAVSDSLDSVLLIGEQISTVKVDGLISKIAASTDGLWVVLTDDTVLKISGSSIVSKTSLPRATFVTTVSVLDGKLVYGSVSRRLVGLVDESGTRESRLANLTPVSVAVTSGKRIWVLDGLEQRLWFLFDSVQPRVFDWNLENKADGSTTIRVRVSDPDNDIASVYLVAYEQQGVLPLGPSFLRMEMVRGVYEATYRPGPGITRVELYVNATDVAGNSVVEKVGELDYSRSQTSPAVTTVATNPANPVTSPLLLSDLLLLVPLILVVTLLLFARKPRRKKSKKR